MKWPWVSRLAFDVVLTNRGHLVTALAATDVVIASARKDLITERARYDALLDKYQSLKMAGAVEVPTPDPFGSRLVIETLQPDEMRDLIDRECGANYRRRAMMLRQLAADRAANVDDDSIRAAILNGVPSDGVPA